MEPIVWTLVGVGLYCCYVIYVAADECLRRLDRLISLIASSQNRNDD